MFFNLLNKLETKKITKYLIEIKDNDKVWQISKRYSDIHKLYKKLKKKKIVSSKFPKKQIIYTDIEKRFRELRMFITSLNKIENINKEVSIQDFVSNDICIDYISNLYDDSLIKKKIKIIQLQENKTSEIYDNLLELKEQIGAQLGYIDILIQNIREENSKREKLVEIINIYIGKKKKTNDEFNYIEQNIEKLDEKYRELFLQHRLRKAGINNDKEQLIYFLKKCNELDNDLRSIYLFFKKYETELSYLEFKYNDYLNINNIIKSKILIKIDHLKLNNFNLV